MVKGVMVLFGLPAQNWPVLHPIAFTGEEVSQVPIEQKKNESLSICPSSFQPGACSFCVVPLAKITSEALYKCLL